MAKSLKDQLLEAGLTKPEVDPRIERCKKAAEEAQERLDDETPLVPFEAPATGRIIERTPAPK